MKQRLYLFLGIFLAYGVDLYSLEQHPFIIRLCAQIESQFKKLDRAVEKLKTAVIAKRIQVENPEIVVHYLDHAQEITHQALNGPQNLQAKKMFLLPTFLETAFEKTVERWIKKPAQVPPDNELHLILRYAESLRDILAYLRTTDKKSLEQSFLDAKSTYLTLFSHCVVHSILLSLYTLKNKRLLDRVLQRLSMLDVLLEEYKKETFINRDPLTKKAIVAYGTWTQDVIQRILSSEISIKNPQSDELWRSKVQSNIIRVKSSLEKKGLFDRVLEYAVHTLSHLTITEPCFDYIRTLLRLIKECCHDVPLK